MKPLFRRYIIRAALLVLWGGLAVSCSKEGMTENATISMTFTTRTSTAQTSATRATGTPEANEQMRTLRVIMVRQATSEILYNVAYSLDADVQSKTIVFNDIAVDAASTDGVPFDFYVIANESAVSPTPTAFDWNAVASADLDALKAYILTGSYTYDTTKEGTIPQAAMSTIYVKPVTGTQSYTIQLEFPLAKATVTFTNTTSVSQTLTDITLPGTVTDRGYLFEQTDGSLPSGITYSDWALSTSTTLAAGASASFVRYFYPGVNASGYQLTAGWGGTTRTLPLTASDGTTSLTSIGRGDHLSIAVKLVTDTEITLDYAVISWTKTSITVPEMN